ncbi:hypothetical protein D3C83_00870 [compost metagenome]
MLSAILLVAGFGVLRRFALVFAFFIGLILLLRAGLRLLLVLALLGMREARGVRAAPRKIGRMKRFEIHHARQLVVAVDRRSDAKRVGHRRARVEQRTELPAARRVCVCRDQRFLHARDSKIEIGRCLRRARRSGTRGGEQPRQIIGHGVLNPEVDAQVLAHVEDELKAQRIVAVAHE